MFQESHVYIYVVSYSFTSHTRTRTHTRPAPGGVLLIGYEMYRLLSLSVPSLAGNKMAVKRRKTAKSNSQNSNSVVDLEENEREMEKLMGACVCVRACVHACVCVGVCEL